MHCLTLPFFHSFLLRLFSVLGASDAYALSSRANTSQVPLAVGLTVGLLALAIIVLGAFYRHSRRRRKSALLDAPATPPHHTAPVKGDQLSDADAPQEDEHRSQHIQPPTHESTLSSNTPTAVPTTSIGIPESGVPPSLTVSGEGSSRSVGVTKMDQATPVEVIEILDEDEEQGDKPPKPTRWWDVTQSRGI